MKIYEINTMKKTLVILVILGSVIVAKGQTDNNMYNDLAPKIKTIEPFTQKQIKLSKVNHYLEKEWQGGLIQLEDDRKVNGYLLRYNIFTDQIELKSIIDPTPVKIIAIGKQKFVYSDFLIDEGSIGSGYFEVIVNGDCKLLKRRYIRNNDQDYRVSKILGTSSAAPATTVIKEYFIKKGVEPAVLLDKTKSSILSNLSDKEIFNDYMQKKFIVIVSESKLIEFITKYNTL